MSEDKWAEIKVLWDQYMAEARRLPLLQYPKYRVQTYTDGIFEVMKARVQPMPTPSGLIFTRDPVFNPPSNPYAEVELPIEDSCPFGAETEALAKAHDDYFWPHKGGCPLCGSDAYVGFAHVECSNGGCGNFVYREGM